MVTPKTPRSPGPSTELYDTHDPIPQPDVAENSSDTTWELWAEVRDKEHARYADTVPMTAPGEGAPSSARGAGAPTVPIRPAPPVGASGLQRLEEEARRNNRVSPKPAQWQRLAEMLRATASASAVASMPPLLTGRDWQATNSLAKRHSFRNFIDWAAANGLVEKMLAFVRALPEDEWHHMGE